MAAGRCAGCGRTGAVRKIQAHALTCQKYITLYATSPQRCLDPEAEYIRYQTEDNSPEARAERRDARLRERFSHLDAAAARQAQRWQIPKDILDD